MILHRIEPRHMADDQGTRSEPKLPPDREGRLGIGVQPGQIETVGNDGTARRPEPEGLVLRARYLTVVDDRIGPR